MLLGGAVFNAVNLALGGDYAGFADQAHFGWVTTAWRAVVAPNQLLFIGLLGPGPRRWLIPRRRGPTRLWASGSPLLMRLPLTVVARAKRSSSPLMRPQHWTAVARRVLTRAK